MNKDHDQQTNRKTSAVSQRFSLTPSENDLPEFGRWQDVQRIYGIKRGFLYTKISDGTIKSISLREPGKKFGCRLIYLPSVRNWLHSKLTEQGQTLTDEAKQFTNE